MSLIALDYDSTWTADPEGWRMFVAMMRDRGHSFVLVTGRSRDGWTGNPALVAAIEPLMPIVWTSGKSKRQVAEREGFKVDIWIDDMPEMIP